MVPTMRAPSPRRKPLPRPSRDFPAPMFSAKPEDIYQATFESHLARGGGTYPGELHDFCVAFALAAQNGQAGAATRLCYKLKGASISDPANLYELIAESQDGQGADHMRFRMSKPDHGIGTWHFYWICQGRRKTDWDPDRLPEWPQATVILLSVDCFCQPRLVISSGRVESTRHRAKAAQGQYAPHAWKRATGKT